MKNKPAFLGIGIESGQTLSGLRMSPLFARSLLEKKWDFEFLGDVKENAKHHHFFATEDLDLQNSHAYQVAYNILMQAYDNHSLIINWGGDHSIAMSTVGAFCKSYSEGWTIWIDAHADVNTTFVSPSGNLHGMPVSLLLGLEDTHFFPEIHGALNPKKIIYLGLRSLQHFEERLIQDLGILNFNMQEIRKRGLKSIIGEIKEKIGTDPVHISFDIDSVDPSDAPATGIPEEGGLRTADLDLISSQLAHLNCKSMDVVEINPLLSNLSDVERTYQVAFKFIEPFMHSYKAKRALHWATEAAVATQST